MEPLIFFHTTWLKDMGINMTIVFNTLFVDSSAGRAFISGHPTFAGLSGPDAKCYGSIVDGLHSLLIDTMGRTREEILSPDRHYGTFHSDIQSDRYHPRF